MITRVTFIAIAVFWVTMNVLLWRVEYGSQGSESAVPVPLVWRVEPGPVLCPGKT